MSEVAQGGYLHEFIDAPLEIFVCNICHLPSRDPHLNVCCGHTFCKSCLDATKKVAILKNTCPMCRSKDFTSVPNKQAHRAIRSLNVLCDNKSKGCLWQGELSAMEDHLRKTGTSQFNGCQFQDLECTNNCGKTIQRQYFVDHVENDCPCRRVQCEHCDMSGKYEFITGDHKSKCKSLPQPCPNACGADNMLLEEREEHSKICPLEIITCVYHKVGCTESFARKDQIQHEKNNMQNHLLLAKELLTEYKKNFQVELSKVETFTQTKISDLQSQLQKKKQQLTGILSIWSFNIHAQAARLSLGNQTSPVIIKLPEFTHKKDSKLDWFSDPFFADSYKLCLRVYADGCGNCKGTHLSVFFCIMKGPNDNQLSWPLRGIFTVQLLNQLSNTGHYSKKVIYQGNPNEYGDKVVADEKSSLGWGLSSFIPHNDLYNTTSVCQYFKDDCVFLQVSKMIPFNKSKPST